VQHSTFPIQHFNLIALILMITVHVAPHVALMGRIVLAGIWVRLRNTYASNKNIDQIVKTAATPSPPDHYHHIGTFMRANVVKNRAN
jgi:hypothetical protein